MKIAVLKETAAGERRVAATPETVKKYIGLGASVAIEAGAGEGANLSNDAYVAAGATIDRLQIGRITVENVEAVVLDDHALEGTLIGVSFLKRLAKYQVENDALLLVQ